MAETAETAAETPVLSVCVPVKDEQDNVLPLIEEIAAALDGVVAYEIVYTDDGSTDGTPGKLIEAKRRFPQLRVVRHAKACGQSQAVASAIRIARGTTIATLDGDGQNDPADIPKLLETLDGQDEPERVLIAGWRTKRRDVWIKRVSSKFANWLRSSLLKDETPDTGCGLKVYRRALFLELPRFNHMHRFMPALVKRAGGRTISVPVNHRHRERGASKYGTLDRALVGIYDLFGVSWLIKRGSVPEIEHVDEG